MILNIILKILIILFVIGCSSNSNKNDLDFENQGTSTPEIQYIEAMKKFDNELKRQPLRTCSPGMTTESSSEWMNFVFAFCGWVSFCHTLVGLKTRAEGPLTECS